MSRGVDVYLGPLVFLQSDLILVGCSRDEKLKEVA